MMFYRCLLCATVVSKWDIKEHHGCPKCAGAKIGPTNLSFFEKLAQLIKHPLFWKWLDDDDLVDPPVVEQ